MKLQQQLSNVVQLVAIVVDDVAQKRPLGRLNVDLEYVYDSLSRQTSCLHYSLQWNTTCTCTTCARPTTGAESETQAVARGGGDGVVELRANTYKMCLNMLLERSQGRAIANFNRDFIVIIIFIIHSFLYRHNFRGAVRCHAHHAYAIMHDSII